MSKHHHASRPPHNSQGRHCARRQPSHRRAVRRRALGDEPVKIGMVNPLTGVLSALAQSEVDGAKYAVAEINKKGGILGRQVQLLVEDSANDVGTGVQKTRKLIDRDQVNVILGDVNSGIAYAMSQVTFEKKVFHIVPGGHTDPITGTNCKWNVFRVCNTTTMDAEAVTPELVKKFGKKWFFITPDYAYGHTLQEAFIKALTKLGGTYEGDMLPINNTDFSATLIKAKAYKPNVLLNNMGGLTQINCMKQFTQFGMQNEMALGGALFELESIKGCPPEAQAGWWDMEWWWNQPNVPEVVKFVADFRAATQKTPTARDWFGYVSVHSVRLAAEKAKVARRSETRAGAGRSRTAAGCGAAARQGALSQGRPRTDAQYLRRTKCIRRRETRTTYSPLPISSPANRPPARLQNRMQDGGTELICCSLQRGPLSRHCEKPSDEAIQNFTASLDRFTSRAMTGDTQRRR